MLRGDAEFNSFLSWVRLLKVPVDHTAQGDSEFQSVTSFRDLPLAVVPENPVERSVVTRRIYVKIDDQFDRTMVFRILSDVFSNLSSTGTILNYFRSVRQKLDRTLLRYLVFEFSDTIGCKNVFHLLESKGLELFFVDASESLSTNALFFHDYNSSLNSCNGLSIAQIENLLVAVFDNDRILESVKIVPGAEVKSFIVLFMSKRDAHSILFYDRNISFDFQKALLHDFGILVSYIQVQRFCAVDPIDDTAISILNTLASLSKNNTDSLSVTSINSVPVGIDEDSNRTTNFFLEEKAINNLPNYLLQLSSSSELVTALKMHGIQAVVKSVIMCSESFERVRSIITQESISSLASNSLMFSFLCELVLVISFHKPHYLALICDCLFTVFNDICRIDQCIRLLLLLLLNNDTSIAQKFCQSFLAFILENNTLIYVRTLEFVAPMLPRPQKQSMNSYLMKRLHESFDIESYKYIIYACLNSQILGKDELHDLLCKFVPRDQNFTEFLAFLGISHQLNMICWRSFLTYVQENNVSISKNQIHDILLVTKKHSSSFREVFDNIPTSNESLLELKRELCLLESNAPSKIGCKVRIPGQVLLCKQSNKDCDLGFPPLPSGWMFGISQLCAAYYFFHENDAPTLYHPITNCIYQLSAQSLARYMYPNPLDFLASYNLTIDSEVFVEWLNNKPLDEVHRTVSETLFLSADSPCSEIKKDLRRLQYYSRLENSNRHCSNNVSNEYFIKRHNQYPDTRNNSKRYNRSPIYRNYGDKPSRKPH